MERIAIVALVVQSLVFHATAAWSAPGAPRRVEWPRISPPPATPTPAAYYSRAHELIVGAADGAVRRIAAMQTRSPRDVGRLAVGQAPVLRLRVDSARDRLWVLTIGTVHVFDLAKNSLLRSVTLPNWYHTDDGSNCIPDLQLDQHGAALVSDNVQPKLWRIDRDTFAVVERRISLDSDRAVDAGFSALVVTRGGALFGAIAAPGSLWRIDGTSHARKISLSAPIHGACALEVLNPDEHGPVTMLVLRSRGADFDLSRIEIERGSRKARVDKSAFGAVPEPAGLLAWSGAVYVVSNDKMTPVLRRGPGTRSMPATSVVHGAR